MVQSPTPGSLYGCDAPASSVMSTCGYCFKDHRRPDDSQCCDPIGGVPLCHLINSWKNGSLFQIMSHCVWDLYS